MKKPEILAIILASSVASGFAALHAQTPPPDQTAQEPAPLTVPPPTFGVGTEAVAVDVVVRDKKGELVKDLTAADFDLYEDGQPQRIEQFTIVARGVEGLLEPDDLPAGEAEPEGAAPAAVVPTRESESADVPSIIAFVFDRMTGEARDMAHKASLTYMSARRAGDYVGVFSVDLALHTVQHFTDDPDKIRFALDRAAAQAGTTYVSSTDQATLLQELQTVARAAENQVQAIAGPGAQAAGQALAAGAAVETTMAEMTLRTIRSYETLEREQAGYATTNSLLSVVQGLRNVPGRKTVVFFSEGISIPPAVQAQFMSVVHAANRSNVAIYTMDAGGLRVHSPTEQTRREMALAERARFESLGREGAQDMFMKGAERNEDLLRMNPHAGLGQLAGQTGGFLIRDTNDARGSFRRIAQDMRFHYVLGYTPTNQNYDGRFREVAVKVRRSGTNVFARQGYFAVRANESSPLLTYEVPAVAVLDRPGPAPHAFDIRTTALAFPLSGPTARVPVLVEVPGTAVDYAPDPERPDSLSADLVVVVRIRNEYNQEVGRLSQRFELSTATDKLEAARSGNILFYRQSELAPGGYTLDAVAYDAVAKKATVERFSFTVPASTPSAPRMSSLMLIERVEQVPSAERDPENPLFYGEALLYPNLGSPYRKSTAPALGFYFTALDVETKGKALVEVLRDHQVVGRLPMDLPAPDATGQVQHAGALPLESFSPGHYELRLSLMKEGQRVASRTAPFTVAE